VTGSYPGAGTRAAGRPVNRGDRVELVRVNEDYERFGVLVGEFGVVELVDSLATVHIRWDCGKRFGVTTDAPADMIRAAPDPADG